MTASLQHAKTRTFSDKAPTTGVMNVYKIPVNIFDKDKIHLTDEYLVVRKKVRVHRFCDSIKSIININNRVKKQKNLVLDIGRELIADIMAGRIPADPINKFAVGTGGYIGPNDNNQDPPKPRGTDTQLNSEVLEKLIDSIEKPNRAANTYIGYLSEDELNGTQITEWCLKSVSGVIFSRATTKPIPKEAGFIYVVRWTIQH